MRPHALTILAGALSAAVALGVAELAAGLLGGGSLVIAVGDAVVDFTPGPLVKAAIEALGTRDKPFLLGTVSAAALLIGALLGPIAAGWKMDLGIMVTGSPLVISNPRAAP